MTPITSPLFFRVMPLAMYQYEEDEPVGDAVGLPQIFSEAGFIPPEEPIKREEPIYPPPWINSLQE